MEPDVAFIEKFLAQEEADALLDPHTFGVGVQTEPNQPVRLRERAEAGGVVRLALQSH